MKLPGPVQVEVYPNHEDFAVRTTGMPGLGALGVTFGEVVAMDSPSARKPGDFNWGATLWHEMSHVFILTATNHRVPRWFTEGLAVHEEGVHSAEWRNRVTPDVLIAIRDKKLLPVANSIAASFSGLPGSGRGLRTSKRAPSATSSAKSGVRTNCSIWFIRSRSCRRRSRRSAKSRRCHQSSSIKQYLAWIDGKYGAEAAHFDEWREKLKAMVTAAEQKQYETVLATRAGSARTLSRIR